MSPPSIHGMASCRDDGLVAQMLLPALGSAAQGLGLETGGMHVDWEQGGLGLREGMEQALGTAWE